MFQKINTKEKIVGWYSSGPKIRPHDIEINEVFRKYCDKPVFVIIDVQEKKEVLGIPAESYIMKEEVDQDGQLIKTFFKLNTTIEASLPEQIGVEFMLKDINDPNRVGSVSKIIKDKEIFQTEVMRILNSNEFNALSCNCYINGINNLEQYIDVTPFYIKLIKNNNVLFDYRLIDDTISFDNNFKINYDNVTELLNTKIPTNEIFDFQKEAIKKSKTKDKEIIFIGNKSHNTFKLCEEEHKVLIKSLPKNTTK